MDIDESYLRYYEGPDSDHYKDGKFFNPWNPRGKKGLLDVLKWRMQGGKAVWPERVENEPRPPIVENPDTPRITYIGHATILVQMTGKNILIDPVFSERCSPFKNLGPKRVRDPFIPMEKLPKIDFVFISHNHYDHLDQMSLSWLAANRQPLMITPLGNTRLIKACVGQCGVVALDWHQSTRLTDDLSLTVTPAQHWSRRGFNDINRDLWGGCLLQGGSKNQKILYTGDSGFERDIFAALRVRYGAPDAALIPIGAYEPRWFMKYSHMNPAEAVETYKALGAKRAMAFHFETFQLTDEAMDAPRIALEKALSKAHIKGQDFVIPYPGDVLSL